MSKEFISSANLGIWEFWYELSWACLISILPRTLKVYVQVTHRENMTESSVVHEPCTNSPHRAVFYSQQTSFYHLYDIWIYSENIIFILTKSDTLKIKETQVCWIRLKISGCFLIFKFPLTANLLTLSDWD